MDDDVGPPPSGPPERGLDDLVSPLAVVRFTPIPPDLPLFSAKDLPEPAGAAAAAAAADPVETGFLIDGTREEDEDEAL